jgi:type II secretory pathway pseudopilin PulG
MKNCARTGGSDSGFTLVEAVLAIVILAAAATTVISIYIHSVNQASYAFDATVATSFARNRINQGMSQLPAPSQVASVPIEDRPSLFLSYEEELPLVGVVTAWPIRAKVVEADGSEVVAYTFRRANYQMPEEALSPEDAAEQAARARGGEPAPEGGAE